jgi:hypothetical protein
VRVFSGGEKGTDALEAKVGGLNRPLEAKATYTTMP